MKEGQWTSLSWKKVLLLIDPDAKSFVYNNYSFGLVQFHSRDWAIHVVKFYSWPNLVDKFHNNCSHIQSGCILGNCEEKLPKKPVGWLSVDCRPSVGWLLAVCWPTVSRLSSDCWPTDGQQSADRFCHKHRLPVGRQSADSWWSVGNMSVTLVWKQMAPFGATK